MKAMKPISYILLSIAILYVLPIILANTYYLDDMGRAILGYSWGHDGRFIASLVAKLLSLQDIVISFYPFSIILSAIIIFISGTILAVTLGLYTPSKRFHISQLTCLILLFSPFLLENLAFRFDSLYMALSIFLAILPIYYYQHKFFILISSVCLFLIFGLYQISSMLYFSALLCLQISHSINNKKILWKALSYSLISFFLAFATYKIILHYRGYAIDRATLLPFSINSLRIVINRLSDYVNVYKTLFISSKYLLATTFLIIGAICGLSIKLYKMDSILAKLKQLLIISLCIFGVVICSVFPNIMLETMWLTARTFIVFPIFIIILAIFIQPLFTHQKKLLKYIATIAYIILLSYSFVLSSIFGSILKNNDDYNNFLAMDITHKLTSVVPNEQLELIIAGSAPPAIRSSLLYNNYPIMHLLAPNYLSEGLYWGIKSLSSYYLFNWPINKEELILQKCDLPLLESNHFYQIRQKENTFIIDFDKCI